MSPTQVKKSGIQQDGNIINQLLFRYLPYWPLFVAMLLLGLGGAYAFIRYKVPVYKVTAAIMIKDEKKGIDDSKVLEQLNLFGSKKIVENEIEIIKSRTLLREVVKNLHLYAPLFEEGKINTVPAFLKSPVNVEMKSPDSLVETVNKEFFVYDKGKQLVTVDGKEYPLNQWVSSTWGTIRFTPNPYYYPSEETKPLFFSLVETKKVIGFLNEQLQISPSSKLSTVINLSVNDPVPVRGKMILNELIKQYDNASMSEKNGLTQNTTEWIDNRLKVVKEQLDSVERKIQNFRTSNNVVDISAQGQQFLDNVGVSDQKVGEIQGQLSVLSQVESYVRSKTTGVGVVPSTLGLDPMVGNLINKLNEDQMQYDKLKKTTGENSPMLITLREEIETLRPKIMETLGSQRSNLLASQNNLSTNTNKYSGMLRSMPEKQRQLLEISRDQATIQANYAYLLQKKEETALSKSATVPDSRVVDEAESSTEPVSPNKLLVLLISIVGALAIAVLIISLKEGLNRNILFRSEIENYTSVPIIGEVIQDETGQPIVIANDRKNFIAEQFRQVRTALSYIGITSRKKKVLVTSSISGEGKSFVAANLAISLALTDKKVVLLEIDLRKPKLSEIFGMKSTQAGISNYLIGEKEADEIIKRTDVNPNLFLISAGPIPPNPSELILNGRIQELLAYLENAFDYIVIDTAPVTPVTDAYLLSAFCDATLYVVRHGYTPRIYLQMLDENNKVRGLKNLALIFNGVKSRGIGKGGFGNGYGYGYGVGYGDNEVSTGKKNRSIFGKAYK
ncbi:MAG: polysaccharide biosynthesis tyrosine autokinase [Flavitalea sp.]